MLECLGLLKYVFIEEISGEKLNQSSIKAAISESTKKNIIGEKYSQLLKTIKTIKFFI